MATCCVERERSRVDSSLLFFVLPLLAYPSSRGPAPLAMNTYAWHVIISHQNLFMDMHLGIHLFSAKKMHLTSPSTPWVAFTSVRLRILLLKYSLVEAPEPRTNIMFRLRQAA